MTGIPLHRFIQFQYVEGPDTEPCIYALDRDGFLYVKQLSGWPNDWKPIDQKAWQEEP